MTTRSGTGSPASRTTRASSARVSTEAWPSPSMSAFRAFAASSGRPSAAASRAAATRSSAASAGWPGRMAVSWITRASRGRPASSSRPTKPGREHRPEVGGQRRERGLGVGEAGVVAERRGRAAERQPEAVGARAGRRRRRAGRQVRGAALDDAGEVGDERPVVDRRPRGRPRAGRRPRRRSRSGRRAARGRAPPRGSARRTRRRAGGAAPGTCAVSGQPFDQAATSSRASGRQASGGRRPAVLQALRLSRSKTVVASI